MNQIQNFKQNYFGHWKLEFGNYLVFACLPVGRGFVIWNFRSLHSGIFVAESKFGGPKCR